MNSTVDPPPSARSRGLGVVPRFALIVLMAFAIGWSLNQLGARLHADGRPAGFWQGVAQGAMMPCALPSLLMGHDTEIFAANHNGVFYKLGYTLGVNVCGAIFFGIMFLRLSRWRRQRQAP